MAQFCRHIGINFGFLFLFLFSFVILQTFYFLQGTYTTPTQPAVALSFLCILLDAIQSLFEIETPHLKPYVDPEFFYNGSLKYTSMDRLGGALSYLKKAFKEELSARIGEEHPFHVTAAPAATPSANQIVFQSPIVGPTRPSDLTICKYPKNAYLCDAKQSL